MYTFKHVFIVKQAIEHSQRVFFILVMCKCNAAAIIRDPTTVFINCIRCVQFDYFELGIQNYRGRFHYMR